jgi:hypothetical protein
LELLLVARCRRVEGCERAERVGSDELGGGGIRNDRVGAVDVRVVWRRLEAERRDRRANMAIDDPLAMVSPLLD